MLSVGLPNLPHISQIRCESIFNGVKVVSLNDFDPVKRRGDGCERDGDHCDHCDHCDDGDGFRCLALFFCVVSRIAGSFFSCASLILDKRCECAKTLPRNDLLVEIVRIILL